MKKKISVVVLLVCLVLSLVGCVIETNGRGTDVNSVLDTEIPDLTTIFDDTAIKLTDELLSELDENTSKYSNFTMTQVAKSYRVVGDTIENETVVANATVEFDLKNKILLTEILMNYSETGQVTYRFADDNVNNIHLSQVTDQEYIASDKDSSVDIIDYTQVADVYDFLNYTSKGVLPSVGCRGTYVDDVYTFTLERDALESDVSLVSYDKLDKSTVTLILTRDKNLGLVPASLQMETTYYVGQSKYAVATVCSFSNFSTSELTMPEYVTTSE